MFEKSLSTMRFYHPAELPCIKGNLHPSWIFSPFYFWSDRYSTRFSAIELEALEQVTDWHDYFVYRSCRLWVIGDICPPNMLNIWCNSVSVGHEWHRSNHSFYTAKYSILVNQLFRSCNLQPCFYTPLTPFRNEDPWHSVTMNTSVKVSTLLQVEFL